MSYMSKTAEVSQTVEAKTAACQISYVKHLKPKYVKDRAVMLTVCVGASF
jgi:hypothetical protein